MKATLLLAALGLPTLALAQSSFAPHAYLGAGISVLDNRPFNSTAYSNSPLVGPVLTAGYQFSPRLAVQLSPAVQWRGESGSYTGYQAIGGGRPLVTSAYRSRTTQVVTPLLLRLTLTNPVAHLRLDGLAGLAWQHLYSTYSSSDTDNSTGTVLTQRNSSYSNNSALLTLGPALRYGLGSHLELALLLPVHYEVDNQRYIDYYVPSFSDHLRFQPQLSAYYALGSR